MPRIITIDGTRWLVRDARSRADAINEIAMARVHGCIGGKSYLDETRVGGKVICIADVVQINSDYSERQPYTKAY